MVADSIADAMTDRPLARNPAGATQLDSAQAPRERRRHRIELLTQEPDLVSAAVTELVGATRRTGGPWRSDARVVRQDESGRPSRLIAIVDVDAHREDAVDWLCDAVVARVGEHLAAPPLRGLDLGGR